MAEEAISEDKGRRKRIGRWIGFGITSLLALLFVAAAAGLAWLDSEKGHEFVIRQVTGLEPESGLRISIGSLEGSIYSQTTINRLTLSDPKGRFFIADTVEVDWRPLAYIFNELSITSLDIDTARLDRLPELIETDPDAPLLPQFDIYLGRFAVERLILGEAIAGREEEARIAGAADIRAGRAMVNLDAATMRGGDKVLLALNAEPDREKLELEADIAAPRNGVIDGFLGLDRDTQITLAGDGDWNQWDGALTIMGNRTRLAVLGIAAREGVFGLDGYVRDALLPEGFVQRIGGPRLAVNGTVRMDEQLLSTDLSLQSDAARLLAEGGFHFGRSAFEAMRLTAQVTDASALVSNMQARELEFRALLNGRLSELRYQYLAASPLVAFGETNLLGVEASGQGMRDGDAFIIPLDMSVAAVTGNGELVERIAGDLQANALLRLEEGILSSNNGRFETRSVNGTIDVAADLGAGDYLVAVNANAPRFAMDGLGVVDLVTSLTLGPGAQGVVISGDATARMRRLDNGVLQQVGGGLPTLTTDFLYGADRLFRFKNLQIRAPDVTIDGRGVQTSGAEFAFDGNGRHDEYGRFDFAIDGRLDRPQVTLQLDSPLPAAGLTNVSVRLVPIAEGFSLAASGGSTLGPFDGTGAIVTRAGQGTIIRIDALKVSDTTATGVIRPTDLGLAGDLDISGGGVEGRIFLQPEPNRQLIFADLEARNARFDGNPPIFIRTGSLDADMVIVDGNSTITAVLQGQGISRGDLTIGRLAGRAQLRGGKGEANFSINGTRGSTFEFQARADIAPDRYVLTGDGEFQRRQLRINRPLVIARAGDGWRVSRTTLQYGNGKLQVAGTFGGGSMQADLQIERMPLSLLDVYFSDLGLGGNASGTINFSQSGNAAPTGNAKLRVNRLTRSGLLLTSRPVDLGLNMALSQRNAAARGVIVSDGKTIGRFQGRVTGLGGGDFQRELLNSPLFAQARFNGAAEALWRLTGVETFDLTGPVLFSADVGGTLANPRIDGQFATKSAQLESALTGTVINNIAARGTFDGSKLLIPQFTGATAGGGTVSGRGSFDFAVEPGVGVGIDMRVSAQRALLIARDDFSATVTGPLTIANGTSGGLIAGNVTLDRSSFNFGQASVTVDLPQVRTREVNLRADEPPPPRVATRPWRFDLTATAPNKLMVDGLGLDSEWRADIALTGPVDDFALTGTANLIRGDYSFAGRDFRLERGRIRFVGNRPPNPILDIEAAADVSGINATINITGRGESPEIAFSSNPQLPQDELLSRILFGESISDITPIEALQLAAAVASFQGGGGLDPINQLRSGIGLDRLRILPSDADSNQGTSIAAGKYLTRNTYVELITDGKGYSATRLEFQITRWLSILSSISTVGRQSVNARISRDY